MPEDVPIRSADSVITWKTYVVALDDICNRAGIPVSRGAELEAEMIDRTALRITVKTSD